MKSNLLNRRRRLNHLYQIIDKQGQSITFKMNKSQEIIYDLEKQYKRFIILKARQLGMSTYKLISGLDKALFYSNKTIIITAHLRDKQQELFQKVKYAFLMLPDTINMSDGRVWRKPKTKYDNVNELFFPELNSKIKVALDSRSGTVTDAHITELAFRNDAREMMSGSLPSIPSDAQVTIETTANGVGNYFYEFRKKYESKTRFDSLDFYPVFIPRYTDDSYKMKLEDGETVVLDEILQHLESLNLTDEQKKRYSKQYELLGKDVFQEYPSMAEEAFLTTGDTVRDLNLIKSLPRLEYTIDPKYRELRIYRPISEGEIMGIDLAEGGATGDFSCISVRKKTGELVAFYYEHAPHDYLAEVTDHIVGLGYDGIIGPEANSGGIAYINKAKEYERISQMYRRKVKDTKSEKASGKLGRYTSPSSGGTRELLTSEYEEAVRQGNIKEVDERLRVEMFSFVKNEKKKMVAIQGAHDDGIMADGICWQMRKERKRGRM